ncbi:carbohydrate ABC transporter permease [Mesomycoplasma flocculare]|uniref:carbohydrate ABC transporter permease n=1 Tax=Mesomycoplasma flocculare TaxID=2128 RepID=UPI00215DA99E|nr:carbohydrate ABC transporter permease [Mesomycoplasma flocculare]
MLKINLRSISLQLFLFICFIFLLFIFLFPLYYLIVNASLPDELQDNPNLTLKLDTNLWNNFKNSLNENFWVGLKTSIFTIILINFMRLFLYSLASFGLWMATKKVRLVFISLFVGISLIPEISIYIPLSQILNENHLITNAPIFSLVCNQIFSFFNLFYLYKSIKKIKKKQIFLAKIDKLSIFSKFKLIIFPKIRISYYLLIIFTTIQAWNDFLWPNYIFTNRSYQTISTWFQYSGQTSLGFLQNIQAVGSLFAISVPLFFYLIFSKFINKTTANNLK